MRLLPALAEAARASESTAARFVPPRLGILEEASARRDQFIFGRRGVGKSTLLRRIAGEARDTTHGGQEVVFIDLETVRERPYPDVLIELLIILLGDLRSRMQSRRVPIWRRSQRRTIKQTQELEAALRSLLSEPLVAVKTFQKLQSRARSARGAIRLGLRSDVESKALKASLGIDGALTGSRSERERATTEAQFERTKMDGLLEAALLVRDVVRQATTTSSETPTLLVLDDFNYVGWDDQPHVLAYMHQVVKNLDVHLKICGVRHRLNPFIDGSPPKGMQPGQDASVLSLDLNLDRFDAARSFLERVLDGICDPLGTKRADLLTDEGRDRLVLGSGGVARDFLSLTAFALRASNERTASPSRLHNRITAEDVNVAAAQLSQQKQDDLVRDAGSAVDQLRARLSDVVEFCLDENRTNVFLVEGTKLQEEDWGKEIQSLADLRFVHLIATLAVQRGGQYRGRKFTAFTLDLSHWTATRSEQINQVPFWTPAGIQQIRRPALIYTDGWRGEPPSNEIGPDAATSTPDPEHTQLEFELELLPPPAN